MIFSGFLKLASSGGAGISATELINVTITLYSYRLKIFQIRLSTKIIKQRYP